MWSIVGLQLSDTVARVSTSVFTLHLKLNGEMEEENEEEMKKEEEQAGEEEVGFFHGLSE